MSDKVEKKALLAIAAIIAMIIIALTLSFGISKSGLKKMEKEAAAYIAEEDYNSAITVYSNLITKSDNIKYKEKKKELILLSEEYDNFKKGVNKIKDKQYISAIQSLVKIERKDSIYYKRAKKELEAIEKNILEEAQTAIDKGNTYLAASILNDYVRIVGDNQKVDELIKVASGEIDITEPTETTDETSVKDKDKDKDKKKKTKKKSDKDLEVVDELPEDSKDWVGKTTTIKVQSAYIKDEPNLDAAAITAIGYGGTITIEKTFDDGGRIWCYGTITSATTDETFEAWISSKMLMTGQY